MIFHITTQAAWQTATALGRYEAESLRAEGFIHFSDRDQVVRTADARFSGQSDLTLLCVDPGRLTGELRYEVVDPVSDERFPHLYGPLNLDAVVQLAPFPEGDDGFELPTTIPAP